MGKSALAFIKLFFWLFCMCCRYSNDYKFKFRISPWDVFHQGLSNLTGITIGRAHILTGISIVALSSIFGEKVGWGGTIFNMLFIGIFIDFLMLNNLIPIFNKFLPSLIMMLLGLLVLGFGCYLYLSVGWGGSGPRDGLMIALVKKRAINQ